MTAEEHVDTGIEEAAGVTATVNGLTSAGREAAKVLVGMPADLKPSKLMQIARDIALDIYPIGMILNNHGLTNAQFEWLTIYNDFFKNALIQQAKEWQSVKSTPDRLAAQAAAALEEQMPVLAMRMGSKSEKLVEAVEAAKLFAKIARVDGDAPGARRSGEGFTITIDLGADTRVVIGTAEAAAPAADASGQPPLRTVGERQGQQSALPQQPEGQGGSREVRQVVRREIAPSASGGIPEG